MAQDKKSRLARYLTLLKRVYGADTFPEERTALEELVHSILAEGATDALARKALSRLREEFVDFNDVRVSREREVTEAIRFLPDAERKARRLRKALDQISSQEDEVGLDFLLTVNAEEGVRRLLSFEGVGARQAADVCQAVFGEVPVVVDEKLKRVLERLGLVETASPDKTVETQLPRLVPKEKLLLFYRLISDHAERICTPTDYQCKQCVLNRECKFYKENVAGIDKGNGRR